MDLIDILRIYLSTYIVHNKMFANPQSNTDWYYNTVKKSFNLSIKIG